MYVIQQNLIVKDPHVQCSFGQDALHTIYYITVMWSWLCKYMQVNYVYSHVHVVNSELLIKFFLRLSIKEEENCILSLTVLLMTIDNSVSYSAMSSVMEHMFLGSQESL